MGHFQSVLHLTILGGYLFAAALFARTRLLRHTSRYSAPWLLGAIAATAAVVLHSYLLWNAAVTEQGLRLSAANSASLMALLVGLVAVAGSLRLRIVGVSAALLPFAAIGALLTGLGQARFLTQPEGWELDAHILLASAAYSVLAIAAVLAVLLIVQDHRLRRRHRLGWIELLPPLETLERYLFGAVAVGFGLLSLALFSGFVFVEDLFAQHLVHKTILSLLAWLIFAVLLIGRWRLGWRGRVATGWTLGGFGVLALAYFGSKIVLELILGRHWT